MKFEVKRKKTQKEYGSLILLKILRNRKADRQLIVEILIGKI